MLVLINMEKALILLLMTVVYQMLRNLTKQFYVFNERTIFMQIYIYILNERIILIQRVIYKFNHSHKKRKDGLEGSRIGHYLRLNLSSRRY